ncbi:hypothetical protein Tco_0824065 [Tanacetum coccineum]|uniref:Uncharacterized protein n=1 Tax=Tanacetum coccineum TaxID=301880 RepID=A0ABQ5ANR2_9ASTR
MSLSLAENVIVAEADNRPIMLDKTNYSSWASHAKQIWDRIKLLIQGSELLLQERESKLYDDFDTFTSMPGEDNSFVLHALAKDMHTTNFDHLYAHQRQHEAHSNEVHLERQRNQATIQDGRVTVQTVQGIQTQGYANNRARNTATNPSVNIQGAPVQARVVKCYNYQEEGYFARQCTKPKRPKNSTWFKEKMLLSKALESGAYLDPEQLAFLADNGDTIVLAQASKEILTSSAFQTDDLDAFDSDCDDVSSAKAVLMANLSSYDSDVLLEVPFHDTNIENDMSYQSVQETQCSEQPFVDNDTEIDITSDSNIISYEQYLQETKNPVVQNTISSAHQDELLTAVIEEMSSQVSKCNKFWDKYKENLVLKAELAKKNDMIKKAVYNELSKQWCR